MMSCAVLVMRLYDFLSKVVGVRFHPGCSNHASPYLIQSRTAILVKRLGEEYEIQLSIDSEVLEKLQELATKAAYYGGGRGIAKELEVRFLKDLLELRIAQWDHPQIKQENGPLKMVGIKNDSSHS